MPIACLSGLQLFLDSSGKNSHFLCCLFIAALFGHARALQPAQKGILRLSGGKQGVTELFPRGGVERVAVQGGLEKCHGLLDFLDLQILVAKGKAQQRPIARGVEELFEVDDGRCAQQ